MRHIYQEGRTAYLEGKLPRDNPYKAQRSLWDWAAWHAWTKGWLDTQAGNLDAPETF